MRKLTLILLMFVLPVVQLLAQTKTITGKVTDEKGNGIANASITVKGFNSGVTSGVDGTFSIEVVSSAKSLIVSAVGRQSEIVNVIDKNNILIVLKQASKELGDVVITGYNQSSTKRAPISSVEIKAKDLQAVPLSNLNEILQGKATGLQISSGSGQPGSVQSVRIRGIGSISAGANPLYVIDGIIVQTGQIVDGSEQQTNDVLANLNPDVIETVTVLKNASGLALYGSRGANGVIVITTKRGKAGTSQISFRSQYGTVSPSFGNFKMMSAWQVYDYERAVAKVNGIPQTQIDIDYPQSLLNNTFNWIDAAFRQGATHNHELSVSGGNDKTRHFISLGYFSQQGTVIGSDFKRITSQINIEQTVNSRLKVGVNANLSFSNTSNASSGGVFSNPLTAALTNSPLFLHPYTPDGHLYKGYEDPAYTDFSVTNDNFLYSAPINYNKIKQFRGLGKLYANLKVTDWLTINQNVAVDLIYAREKNFRDPTTNDGYNPANPLQGGAITESLTQPYTFTSQTSLTGAFKIGEKHDLDYLLLTEYQGNNTSFFSASGLGIGTGNSTVGRLDALGVSAQPSSIDGNEENYSFLSFLAQINYTYDNKYSFSASLRRDGSSRFGINNQYANFYSLGAAWRIIDEQFMKNQTVFSDLKFRASFGTSGNADFRDTDGNILNYASKNLYRYNISYNGSPASLPSSVGNPNLTWEKNQQADIGFEMAFLKGRIKVVLETYQRISRDLLQNLPVSSTTGFTTVAQNVGKLENRGIEIAINTTNIQTKDFVWSTNFNISYNVNKVLATFNNQDILGGTLRITRVGKPINSWYLPEWAGVDPNNGNPLWYDDSGAKTSTYSKARRVIAGRGYPTYIMSMGNTLTYKGFSLAFLLYGVTGNTIYNQTNSFVDSDGRRFGWNYSVRAGENFWTTPGQKADRPKPIIGGNLNSNSTSTRYAEDGSYLRLRNITLAYNLPVSVFGKTGLTSARFYITGTNLLTFTKFTGIDPETDITANDFFKYPVSKAFTVGVDITF